MRKPLQLILALPFTFAGAAGAQNGAARPTPQTQNSAPAAIGDGPKNARATGSGATSMPGTPGTTRPASPTSQNARRAGPSTGSTAASSPPRKSGGGTGRATAATDKAATGKAVIAGDADGSGIPVRIGKIKDGAALPGVALQHNALGVMTGAPIQVRLQQPVDSGHTKNGDTLRGVLVAPLGRIPAGAPVELTVVATAAAGELNSNGELSLQVIRVNGEQVLSDVITAQGKEGAKIMPDDAPKRGTEASFTPDQTITLPAA